MREDNRQLEWMVQSLISRMEAMEARMALFQETVVRATLRPVPPRRQPQMGVCRNGLILRLTDHISNHPTLTTLGGPE